MNSNRHDFYSGFEGEPELVIERRMGEAVCESVHAWIGHFESLMDSFPAPPGGWAGIALHHHMDTGWNDGEWSDPSPGQTSDILEAARRATEDDQARLLADTLIGMYRQAVSKGGAMVWRID